MIRVALTGNIASGKSAVAEVWQELGAAIIDADELARLAVEPGTPGLERVREAFGPDVITADGRLDRDALRRRVFADPAERRRLEQLLHPEIARLRDEAEARLRTEGKRIVVHMIPLLFEVGMEHDFDRVVLVDAPEATRLERLVRGRGLAEEEARAMIAAQMPSPAKRAGADIVIDNDGSLDELRRRAREVWRRIETET